MRRALLTALLLATPLLAGGCGGSGAKHGVTPQLVQQANALGKESHDLETLDQHLLVAQRTGERWGVHCSFGAIPLSRIPPG